MSNSRNSDSGFGVLFLGLLVLGAVLWILSIALWVLGLGIIIVGLFYSVWLLARGWAGVRRAKDVEAIEVELQGMAQDCAADLGGLQLKLLELGSTKGIGTPLEEELGESNWLIDELYTKCDNEIQMCHMAPGTPQRVEAILNAEQVRTEVRDKLTHG